MNIKVAAFTVSEKSINTNDFIQVSINTTNKIISIGMILRPRKYGRNQSLNGWVNFS